MPDDRFLLADFIGRQNQPTLWIIWHRLNSNKVKGKSAIAHTALGRLMVAHVSILLPIELHKKTLDYSCKIWGSYVPNLVKIGP